ncbi:Zn(2+)-responsive transcriptional regulator [Shewanella intestini]|uniref:Zn(2+)-responsive transcriptional regulator n=1 Tax=Shewanella intestini TaxID=2017544 RepID=A0ABS5I0K2_9GAMM|nr:MULTISPECIES: Zn(2+)-responsive transcriptional regulator [Shewanella]MBR9727554.1 Zn(2+)-responsive transcriptional regulator [Shewanella intestini]MRG35296.1 Zn(2+)-responsive transcriptional regulator [Shewanella sp. XMDDZSB0408]
MYRIGELSNACAIKADTLRFYEKHGLLTPSHRSDSGYRLYTEDDAARLRFILRAKAVGFTLNEIGELLSIELDKSNWACADVKKLVDVKHAQVEAKIAELMHFASSLKSLSDACCGGPDSAEHCSILDALESSDKMQLSEQIQVTPEHHHNVKVEKSAC